MFGGVDQMSKQILILPFASQCASIFGKFISHDLRDAVISEYLSHVIPTEISEFKQFEEVANAVWSFQAEMRKMGFMRTPREDEEDEERTLGSYVAKVDVLFIVKKRDKLLELGRSILLEDNFENSIITEEEKESEVVTKENLKENIYHETVKSDDKLDKFAISETNNDGNPNEGWEVDWNEAWDEGDWNNESSSLNQNNQNGKSVEEIRDIPPPKLEKKLIQYSISMKSKHLIDLTINTLNEIPSLNAKRFELIINSFFLYICK